MEQKEVNTDNTKEVTGELLNIDDERKKLKRELSNLTGDWYIVRVFGGQEKQAKLNLENRINSMNMEDSIFEVSVPIEEVLEGKKGQKKVVKKVRSPGYLFVRMNLDGDSWYVVANTPGIYGFIGDAKHPVALDVDELVDMFLPERTSHQIVTEELQVEKEKKDTQKFSVNESILITSGPFAGFPATIAEFDNTNRKLQVLVFIFGRETPIELSYDQVEKKEDE
jgi:transcriptional antiterminator NusG